MSKVAKAFVGNDGMAHKQANTDSPEYMECGVELSPHDVEVDVYRRREAAMDAGYEWCADCWTDVNEH